MTLSETQFAAALAGLRGADSTAIESRRKPRALVGAPGRIVPCSDLGPRPPVSVLVMNLSETGVGILLCEAMREGDSFILSLPGIDSGPKGGVLCCVAHATSQDTGTFLVGARFVGAIPMPTETPDPSMAFEGVAEAHAEDVDHLRAVEERLKGLSLGGPSLSSGKVSATKNAGMKSNPL